MTETDELRLTPTSWHCTQCSFATGRYRDLDRYNANEEHYRHKEREAETHAERRSARMNRINTPSRTTSVRCPECGADIEQRTGDDADSGLAVTA